MMKTQRLAYAALALILSAWSYPEASWGASVTDDGTTVSTYKPKTAAELTGSVIDYEHRADYWSVGQPNTPAAGQDADDVMRRIFMFYNVKTGKFLSLGGWWGMRTVLSDFPHLFWLQRRNESLITAENTVRYPLAEGETTVVPSLLEHMCYVHQNRQRSIGIGSQQGDESFATYTTLQVVDATTGDTVYTIDPTKGTNGHFGVYHDIDLSKQRIEAVIDLSTCKNNNENILSIGSAINLWGWGGTEQRAIADNIHIYYNATNTATTNLQAHELQIVYLGVRCNNPNGEKTSFYNVMPDKPLTLHLTNQGLSVSVSSGSTYFASEAATLTANGKIQVGSVEGKGRSYATYNHLQIEKGNGTITKIVPDSTKAEGNLIGLNPDKTYVYNKDGDDWGQNYDFDINNDKITAEIDVTSCKNDNENILSIGRIIGKWLGYNLHLYYTDGKLQMNYTHTSFSENTNRKTFTLSDKTKPLLITYSKDGVVVKNGDTQTTMLFSGRNLPLQYADGNRMDIGNVQGDNRSHATYNSVKVGSADLTKAFNNADKTKGYSTSQVIDINSESVDAEINLSTCTGNNENILTFGDDVTAWKKGNWGTDKADSIGRIHLYYTASSKALTAWYCGRGQQMQFKRIIDPSKPLTVHFSKAKGLVIDGTSYFGRFEIPYTAGLEGEQVRFKIKNEKENMPEIDDKGNYIIDQEGGKGITRVYTNYIYANESRSEKRQTYFISSKLTKSAGFSPNEGNLLAYTNLEAGKADYNSGTYGDRVVSALGGMNSPEVSQWSFDKVEDPSGQGQNLYTLSLTMKFNAESSKGENLKDNKQFFLAPTQKYVYGPDGNKYYDSDTSQSGQYNTDEYTDVELTSIQSDLNYWKVISLYDYRQIMQNSDSELRNQVDATYLISDPDFTRESGVLKQWQCNVDKTQLRIGYDGYYKTATTDKDYTETAAGKDKRYNHSRYMAANIYNGGRGEMYQDIKVFVPGWYVVHCQGMTNVGAKLFVREISSQSKSTRSNTKVLTPVTDEELATLRSTDTSVAHWPMDTGMPLYNSTVWMNDVYRKDADLAKYDNQVLLYVDDASIDQPATLRIGVRVDSGKDGVATEDEWTVFDNFRIQFGGASAEKEPFLILDEDKTSLDYIDKGVHPYTGKALLLHRTFKKDNWNTLILPVSLTKAQYVEAFGEGSRLAYLTSLSETKVNFTSVKIAEAKDDEVVLSAGEPYIIYPIKEAGNTSDGTQEIWTWESNGEKSEKVSVGTPYYTILGVTLNGPKVTADNEFEHYNFTAMTDYYDKNLYVKASTGRDGDGRGTMVMKGTYCKTYEGTNIIEGRPTLNFSGSQYAYVMSGNDMRRLPQGKPYGTKGLRCWFEYTLNSSTQSAPQVVIDGIGGEVTSIDDIQDDVQPMTARYADGIYSLSGQLLRHGNQTQGLPDGIYIVNGKKILVTNK